MIIPRYDLSTLGIKYLREIKKKSDTCILLLTFNQKEILVNNLGYYLNQNCDVLIVDNNSNDGTFEFLSDNFQENFNVISLNRNLGGAGGFATGLEYIIQREYKFVIITEEDAIPLDEDLIQGLLENKAENRIVRTIYSEINNKSLAFHFSLYDVDLIKLCGVVNLNYFFRNDDWEFYSRIITISKFYNKKISEIVINKRYSHPIRKVGFNFANTYFDIRNSLRSYSLFPVKNSFSDINKVIISSLLNSTHRFLSSGDLSFIKIVYFSIFDFLRNEYTEKANNNLLLNSYKYKVKVHDRIDYMDTDFFSKNFYINNNLLTLINDFPVNTFVNKIVNIIKFKQVVSGKYIGPTRILSSMFKYSYYIEDIDVIHKKVGVVKQVRSSLWIFTFLQFIFTGIISLLILIFIQPFIFSRCLLFKYELKKLRIKIENKDDIL